MKKNLPILTFCFLMVCNWQALLGQATPFWSENFTNGIPQGWTTEDQSPNGCLWTWCADPELSDGDPGCPDIWNTPSNQQKPFAAPTAKTGFATMDSDDCGQISTDHISQLTTSAIDCSSKSQVWLSFATHIGTYTYTADDHAYLKVSTNNVDWTYFQVFNGLTTTVRWSKNPEIPIVDISSVAANQATVYLQWEWTGNYEYHWSVDDVELYDKNPTPPNDLAITEFFYPASSFATPEKHIGNDVFGFAATISNKGLDAQNDVVLRVRVENENGFLLHYDSVLVGTVDVGITDVEFPFISEYTPELVEGRYFIKYSLSAALPDQRPGDNETSSEFLVTKGQFAKENRPEQAYRPSDLGDSWFVCNYYRLGDNPNEEFVATSAEFTYTTDPDEFAMNEVIASVYLMRVNDDIDDELSNLEDSDFFASLTWAGIGEFIAPDSLQDNFPIVKVDLQDFNAGAGSVALENKGRYLLAISYSQPTSGVYHAFNNDNNYYFTSTLVYTDQFSTFGSDANAVLRLNTALKNLSDVKPLPESAMNVFPNPVGDVLNLDFGFEKPTDATITIAENSGKVISVQRRETLQTELVKVPVAKLAPGTYIARVATSEGTRTLKFVKM